MQDCIFCKLAHKEIPKELSFEDDSVVVFPDLHPAKPVHLLIIPKLHISEFVSVEDPTLFSKVGTVIQKMIKEQGLTDKGYRIIANGGGAQEVNHLHFHLMGPMGKSAAV